MSSDLRNKPVDELETSVRTAGLLSELGVKTVGDLMDLPELRASKLVLAELKFVFEELGIEFEGTWVPTEKQAELQAIGTVKERWAAIRAWLEEHCPRALEDFREPATSEQIAAAEEALERTLPDDYKEFLSIHNGQEGTAPMVGYASLLPVEELHETMLNRMFGEEIEVDAALAGEGVRPVELSPGWIPIGVSARGRDYLCIDLDPAPSGNRGQIIEFIADDNGRPLVAKSFADLLSLYFEQLQSGEIELDEYE